MVSGCLPVRHGLGPVPTSNATGGTVAALADGEHPHSVPALSRRALSGVNHGSTVYPQQIGVACTWNTELAEERARRLLTALRAMAARWLSLPWWM